MIERDRLALFGALFAYPRGDVCALARRAGVDELASWAEHASAGEIEEAYCAAFEFGSDTAPYVGHQLCADAERRGIFLAELAGRYAREGFAPSGELPDHFSEVLRFLAVARAGPDREELLRDGLAPAAARVAHSLQGPYRALVEALRGAVS